MCLRQQYSTSKSPGHSEIRYRIYYGYIIANIACFHVYYNEAFDTFNLFGQN